MSKNHKYTRFQKFLRAHKIKVVYVDGDGWNAVYLNSRLVYQGHDRMDQDICKALDFTRVDANYAWLDKRGDFPNNLAEVQPAGWVE